MWLHSISKMSAWIRARVAWQPLGECLTSKCLASTNNCTCQNEEILGLSLLYSYTLTSSFPPTAPGLWHESPGVCPAHHRLLTMYVYSHNQSFPWFLWKCIHPILIGYVHIQALSPPFPVHKSADTWCQWRLGWWLQPSMPADGTGSDALLCFLRSRAALSPRPEALDTSNIPHVHFAPEWATVFDKLNPQVTSWTLASVIVIIRQSYPDALFIACLGTS